MTNIVAAPNPTISYSRPAIEGPMKAPSANVDVHKPDIKP